MPEEARGLMRCGVPGLDERAGEGIRARAQGALAGAIVASAAAASLKRTEGAATARDCREAMGLGGGDYDFGPGQVDTLGEFVFVLARSVADDGLGIAGAAEWLDEWARSGPIGLVGAGMWSALTVGAEEQGFDRGRPMSDWMQWRAASFADCDEAATLALAVPTGIATAGRSDVTTVEWAAAYSVLVTANDGARESVRSLAREIAHAVYGRRSWADEMLPALRPRVGAGPQTTAEALDAARYAVRCARTYEGAVEQALGAGGASSAVAVVAGALYGAMHGVERVPLKLRTTVERADPEMWHHPRPERYVPRAIEALAVRLVEPSLR